MAGASQAPGSRSDLRRIRRRSYSANREVAPVMMAPLFGWLLIVGAVCFAIRMNLLDRRLQSYRLPGAEPSAFWLVPLRWRSELYSAEGAPLVRKSWLALGVSFACAALGAFLLAVAT